MTPDFVHHPLLGMARVADLLAYRWQPPRVSLAGPKTIDMQRGR